MLEFSHSRAAASLALIVFQSRPVGLVVRHHAIGLFVGAGLAFCASQASAADLGRPVYKGAPIVAAYNWSGFYVGIHGGYGWGDGDIDLLGRTIIKTNNDGLFGGGQLGWNWQAAGSPWVFGVEADLAFADLNSAGVLVPGVLTGKADTDWFGTARLRLGYAWDRVMFYTTGGLAFAHNEISFTGFGTTIASDQTHTGFALGGGFEWALADGWTAKAEYLYLDLSKETYFGTASALGLALDADLQFHTIKVGLNYRWGGGKGPVVAKY